jgi:Ca2+-binding RTX toxin-like protein
VNSQSRAGRLIVPALVSVMLLFPLAHTQATNTLCSYDSGTDRVTLTVSLIEDVRLFVTGGGEFRWEDTQTNVVTDCQNSTVNNTGDVVVNDFSNPTDLPEIILDFRHRWGPGVMPEATGRSEIEVDVNDNSGGNDTLMILGSPRRNHFVFGASGFNLNSDNDGNDVQLPIGVIEELYAKGRERGDQLSVRGGSGTGADFVTESVTLQGDGGSDSLLGGDGDEDLRGIDGDDTLLGGLGVDQLFSDDGDDLLKGGRGPDELDGQRGKDRLRGQRGSDDLEGGPGDDDLEGGLGTDTCEGGSGVDSINGCEI